PFAMNLCLLYVCCIICVNASCRKKTGESFRRSFRSPVPIFSWLRPVIRREAESRSLRPIAA
ncbi:MAG: hypothetical protein LUP91_10705, partial [Methylococcaceae bacterium]|nr:hypothetical protein [Methylococcaceae bacterium]